MRNAALVAILALAAPFCAFADNPAPTPALTAADILREVRDGQASKHETLAGQLRTSGGAIFPFQLVSNGPLVRYVFPGPPPVTVQVHYNDENSQLEEVTKDAGVERMTGANFNQPILGTDLTFEDLALKFLYWSRATIEGDDSIRTRSSWKILLVAPTHRTQYSSVRVWIDKESGALLRAEATDWQGHLAKRFEVISGQKIEGKWYLKQLRIEGIDPATGHVRTRTWLEIKGKLA